MTLLAIDTSTDAMGIALYQGKQVIAEYSSVNKNKHSTRLMPAINQVMNDANVKPKDLEKIAVVKGPGSYTGVRIGLSIAKTLAFSLNIPIVGLSSLEMLALNALPSKQLICPFLDARRGLVYTGLYQAQADKLEVIKSDQNLMFEDWLTHCQTITEAIIFISPDLNEHADLIKDKLGDKAILYPEGFHSTRPSLLAITAKDRTGDDIHHLTPNYIRLVEAEAKWMEAEKEKNNG